MTSLSLPKPELKDCAETSLALSWEGFDTKVLNANDIFKVQYKLAAAPWNGETTKEFLLPRDGNELRNVTDIPDLEPGTPYSVRFVVYRDGSPIIGPEIVFDTKPITCTPKERKCTIM